MLSEEKQADLVKESFVRANAVLKRHGIDTTNISSQDLQLYMDLFKEGMILAVEEGKKIMQEATKKTLDEFKF